MHPAWYGLTCLLACSGALADVISPAPESVRVTLYRDPGQPGFSIEDDELPEGLAMVTETRTIDLPAGETKLLFHGVAAAIVPQTATVEGLPALILESNFDYDLLTPGAVLAKSHGARVQLVRTDAATGRVTPRDATVRTGPDGVLLDVDGKIEALNCSGLTEKLVFEHIPDGLTEEPTLSMIVRADKAGRHTIKLSYLSLGLDWSASYIATLNPDGRTLSLIGWLTLVNGVSTTFANAPTQVVAGQLARDEDETQAPQATVISQSNACWPVGPAFSRNVSFKRSTSTSLPSILFASEAGIEEVAVMGIRSALQAEQGELGDYKLYTLPEPTTVAARQAKQVRFLTLDNVSFDRVYRFRLDEDTAIEMEEEFSGSLPPDVLLRLKNESDKGLGKPLPSGAMIVIEPMPGRPSVLVGEDTMQDTPVGLPFEIELGHALDVWVEPRIIELETVADSSSTEPDEERATVEVRFGNDKPVPVVLEYRQPTQIEETGIRIVKESRRHALKDGDALWTIRLEPGQRAFLRYTFARLDL